MGYLTFVQKALDDYGDNEMRYARVARFDSWGPQAKGVFKTIVWKVQEHPLRGERIIG